MGTKQVIWCGLSAASVLLAGCSLLGQQQTQGDEDVLAAIDPADSLTAAGMELAAGARLPRTAPRYHLAGSVTPGSGRVEGTVTALLPVGEQADMLRLRYFAGLPSFEAEPEIGEVLVEGEPASARRRDSVVTVRLPEEHAARVELVVPFSYTLPPAEEGGGPLDSLLAGGGLEPADIGLLSRHEDVVSLGHWFPVWVPPGRSAEPVPDGFGDIGNFPAAMISLELSVPSGWSVVDGGVRTGAERDGDRVVVRSEGAGMRDLVVSVVRDHATVSRELGGTLAGVTVSVHGPRSAKAELDAVLEETVAAVTELSAVFGDYPWQELDVVSAPLGSGVAGMEWPGAVWVETETFAGGAPGLAGLEDLEALSGLLGERSDLLGDLPVLLRSARAWTIAHEVGHEWWHVIVGNDSVRHPVVDEPLAQYSACLVLRDEAPAGVCAAHIESGYAQMRLLGAPDAAAARRTDAFASAMQYAGLVYGKAAAFYLALEEEFGRDAVEDALSAVVAEHAFTMMSGPELAEALAEQLGDREQVAQMWRHWMKQAHGDADLGVPESGALGGLLGDLPGLLGEDGRGGPGLDQEMFDELLRELLESQAG